MAAQQPHWASIDTPALLVDVEALDRNIEAMATAFAGSSVALRPHAKTHKSVAIARRQIAAGAIGVTCAKVGEAEALVGGGLRDVLIANQVVGPRKIARLLAVASAATMTVAADNAANVADLSTAAHAAGVTLGVLVEIDIGMGRAGVRSVETALDLARAIARAPGLRFRGLLGYEGHIVDLPAFGDRVREAELSLARLGEARRAIEGAGIAVECVSAGGTGTYAITSRLSDLTEVEVGSYVFMDAAYTAIEGMEAFAPALTVLATVTSRPTAEVAIVDAGLKTMGGEYGAARLLDWPEARCAFVSEEHARFDFPDGTQLRIGDRVRVVPPHCCTTSNLHDRFYAVRGEAIEAIWPIEASRRSQ